MGLAWWLAGIVRLHHHRGHPVGQGMLRHRQLQFIPAARFPDASKSLTDMFRNGDSANRCFAHVAEERTCKERKCTTAISVFDSTWPRIFKYAVR